MITVNFQKLSLECADTILDIGCGSGRHTAAAYDLHKGLVVGADTNLDDLKAAETRLSWHENFNRHEQNRWSLAGADITALPFRDQSMDLVICSEVLEHIPNPNLAIGECIRVLRPGKHMVVSVPRRWPETICWALSRQYRTTEGGHIRIYQSKRLIQDIQSSGMIHWATHYAHSLHAPYWWLKCLVGPHRDQLWPVALYNRFLTWDLMENPRMTRLMESLLDPIMGKSVVLYFRKETDQSSS
ncbi:MAG: methyltransferase domain-containing protein [Desulfobacteraceae bacterium]|jgi:ubiquinone/menaquinone biosynthesis C-methylase UbiE